ncbi:MAG: hypothetical protein CXR30_01055 [Geobacter sp.]|nr:MAG: hypothetical protein CXR30_01055 [Geobacter sp.]
MPLSLFEGALGGIGLFLLGMRLMSDGIRTVANDRVRGVFAAFTANRVYSLLFGVVMSVALNSASAAVMFTIGLINGGVLTAFQALNILGGVLIGSALTLHFTTIPYSLVATPLVFIGVILKFFARRRRYANSGDLLLGIGLLFLGLSLLEGSFRPFEAHPLYTVIGDMFFKHSLLSFLFGGIISCLVQSVHSSVTVIAALTASRHLNESISFAMVLGGFGGVAVMGCLASVTGRFISRRIALSFLFITVCSALLMTAAAPFLADMLQHSNLPAVRSGVRSPAYPLYSQLVWIYTVASLLMAVLISVFSGYISRLLGVTIRDRGNISDSQTYASYIDTRILNTPILAIEQARKEITRMMSVTSFMYADVRGILFDFDARRADTIRQHEQVLDSLNHEITAFLATLARSSNSTEISYDIPGLIQTITDLEHVGDHCEEILNRIVDRKEAGIIFSDAAMHDLKDFVDLITTVFTLAEDCVTFGQRPADDLFHDSKNRIRAAFRQMKQTHFERISTGVCPPRSALLYMELTTSFMRIAELCWNIMAVQRRRSE